ncbi:MAG: tRNA (adenosine(37)-N6)-dimethylallyltransferase MiaA [Saprospiraceae bacterium]|nr:tRNA (adenosine(37)-N6)-dimethylallyltransferase MiaA [Saprospiraceae bacterium]
MLTIAGPTAVGKTDLCLNLAKKYDAEIFSADSRQLYKELSIGTAKPSQEELESVKHHFINHISIHEEYNVGMYEREIDSALQHYFIEKNVGILSGGTGLYIKAALEGLDNFPDVDIQIKESYEKQYNEEGIKPLQASLLLKDPEYAEKVDLANSRRLIRALSVIDSSGQKFSSFLNQKKNKKLSFTPINCCLERPRDELYDRINKRVDQMIDQGLLEEARSVAKWQQLKSLQTVGYSELFKYFNDEINLHEAIELIKRNSRRYAKRQMTWFRNQGNWIFLNAGQDESAVQIIEDKIKSIPRN